MHEAVIAFGHSNDIGRVPSEERERSGESGGIHERRVPDHAPEDLLRPREGRLRVAGVNVLWLKRVEIILRRAGRDGSGQREILGRRVVAKGRGEGDIRRDLPAGRIAVIRDEGACSESALLLHRVRVKIGAKWQRTKGDSLHFSSFLSRLRSRFQVHASIA